MFLASSVNLPNRTNARCHRFLVLSGVARVNTLCEIGHLHRQNEERQPDGGKNADYEGIIIKKLLVPTQVTAPENIKKDPSGHVPNSGRRLYIIGGTGTVPTAACSALLACGRVLR